jgi:hypothetical protein
MAEEEAKGGNRKIRLRFLSLCSSLSSVMVSFGFRPDDPLDRLLAAAKDTREQKAKARRVNDEIDQYLRNERLRQARIRAFQVKLLLLGSSNFSCHLYPH